jgi:hypothetical protein
MMRASGVADLERRRLEKPISARWPDAETSVAAGITIDMCGGQLGIN